MVSENKPNRGPHIISDCDEALCFHQNGSEVIQIFYIYISSRAENSLEEFVF